jgi:hypothetical protein
MSEENSSAVVQCGRRFSAEEIEGICETVKLLPHLAPTELVATICEHLGWYTAAGGLKADACEKLLLKLEARGLLKVRKKRAWKSGGKRIAITARTDPCLPINCSLKGLGAVRLEPVEGAEKRLFNEYIQRYHPLGYRQPFGYRMRYFIETDRGRLGCLLFSGAAKSLGARDRWIGWTEAQRLQRLAWVVNLSRHLVLPWVQVRNLSSHALSIVCRRIAEDWQRRWSYRPVLLETFVDPRHYEGSCYKAAGWHQVGMSTGEGLVRPGHHYLTTPKKIFLKPLCGNFRAVLCSQPPAARGIS